MSEEATAGTDTVRFGGQSMVAPLRRVLVKRPGSEFAVEDPVRWNYVSRPDEVFAREEHDALVAILRGEGIEVLDHPEEQPGRADAIYVFDPALITDRGAVILSMGKDLRRGEEGSMARRLSALEIPTLAVLEGNARAEGGDMFWLDERTLAIGIGFRTNAQGAQQIGAALASSGVEIVTVELPYHSGPVDCLHLLSFISMVDRNLAVVYPPLMSVPFWQELDRRGIRKIEVPEEEFATMGPNVLALGPRKCLVLDGNPVTRRRLETAGCEVLSYKGEEISLKAEGGPTCLTRPLLRCE